MRIVLFVSLALNLLIVGLVVGAVASGQGPGKPRVDFNLGPFVRALDEEDRRAIVRDVRRNSENRAISPRERRADLLEMIELLRADTFDEAAMLALLAEQRSKGEQLVATAHEALVDRLAASTPERRATFADRLEDEMRRQPRRPQDGNGRNGN